MIVAAQSGNIEQMRPVLRDERADADGGDLGRRRPDRLLEEGSADGEGRDVLAAMLNVFSSGFVR